MNGDKKVAAHTDTFNGREPTTGRVFVHSRQVRTAAGHAANGGQLRQRRPPLTCGGRVVTAVAAGRQTASRRRLTQRQVTLGAGIDVLRRRRSKRGAARARGRVHHHHSGLTGVLLLFTLCGYASRGASDAGSTASKAIGPPGSASLVLLTLGFSSPTNTNHQLGDCDILTSRTPQQACLQLSCTWHRRGRRRCGCTCVAVALMHPVDDR